MDQTILNRSLLVLEIESPHRRTTKHAYHSIVTGDGQLITFLSEEPSSPPVYANQLNPNDPHGYPVRVFDMNRKPMLWRPECQDKILSALLIDFTSGGPPLALSRAQCTDQFTGEMSFTQSYTRGPDGRVGQFIVPSHLLDKVVRINGVKHGAARLGDMRQPVYGSFTLDSCMEGTYDYEMVRGPLREANPPLPIAAGVRHAMADIIVNYRADLALMRKAHRDGMERMKAETANAASRFKISEMPEGVSAANLVLPPRVDPNNDWVVEDRMAVRG